MKHATPIAAALALCTSAAWAGAGLWTTNGPEGGDAAYIVVDATAPDTLLVAGRGGVFRSTDAGATWSPFEAGLDYSFPYALEAATASSTAYVAPDARHVFRSSAGAAWLPTSIALASGDYLQDLSLRGGDGSKLILSADSGLYLSNDSGNTVVIAAAAGLPTSLPRVRVEYASATRLYVAFNGVPPGETAVVWRSEDGGANFAPTAD